MLPFSNTFSGSFYSIDAANKSDTNMPKQPISADTSAVDQDAVQQNSNSFSLRLPDRMSGRQRGRSVSDVRG
jgi:hypothetical protein